MRGHCYSNKLHFFRKGYRLYLAIFWIAGFLTGMWSWFSAGPCCLSMMRTTPNGCMSIVGLICVNILPFLFSAFAVYVSIPEMIFPLCFCRAFFTFVLSLGIMQSFPCAGWLFCILLQGCITDPLLYFYWLRIVTPKRHLCHPLAFLGIMVAVILAVSMDFYIISPVLEELLYF